MNRQLFRDLLYNLTKPFQLGLLRKVSGENFIFPFYHLVSDTPLPHVKHLYPVVTKRQFLSDLDYLLKHFKPATTEDVLNYTRNHKKTEQPFFFLSFDDGMRECYDIVFPILEKKGLQAAFFVNPAFIGNKALFFRHRISLILETIFNDAEGGIVSGLSGLLKSANIEKDTLTEKIRMLGYDDSEVIDEAGKICGIDFNGYLKKVKPYMTLEQIRELHTGGFLIGSHGYDHPEFGKIDEKVRQWQVTESMDYLRKNINPVISAFAFPFTDVNVPGRFFDFLYNKANVDVTFGTAGIKKDPEIKHIQRIPMEVEGKNAEKIIRSEYAYFWGKSIFGKNRIKRT